MTSEITSDHVKFLQLLDEHFELILVNSDVSEAKDAVNCHIVWHGKCLDNQSPNHLLATNCQSDA